MHGGDIYRNRVEMDFSVNINPLGIPAGVRRALLEAVEDCPCYPDIMQEELKQAIHEMTGADRDCILCGNGASELFPAIVHAMKPRKILIPVPSFTGYERAARAGGAELSFHEMCREDGFCLGQGILEALSGDVDMLFLANPNNPVGNCIGPALLERIMGHCQAENITVVLDECFIEFTEDWERRSFLGRIGEFRNLVVVRSFTKCFAIPGVRLGYLACGDPKLLARVEAQLPEWNISIFAQKAGIAAAKETEYLKESAGWVRAEREYLMRGLDSLGIQVYPGTANYLFFYSPYPLAEELSKRGILIRDCSNYRGLDKGYYRIAVGRREANGKLLEGIGEIVCR